MEKINKPYKVSVIIPTYNAAATLYGLVSELSRQNYPDFEIMVIDDKSTDDSISKIEGIARVKVLRNEVNRGPAYSRNRGIEESSGDILLLIDSDCIVSDGELIAKHARAHKELPYHVIGGGIQGVGKSLVARADKYNHWMLNIPNSANKFRTHLVTNNMSVKREVFERIGGFDETLRTGEDTDFCERALKAGMFLGLDTSIIVQHQDRERLKDYLNNLFKAGLDRIPARKDKGHRYSFLLPWGPVSGILYCVPLAVGIALQIIYYWFPYDRRVLLYLPVIFTGCLAESSGIMIYCLRSSKKIS